MARRSAAQRPLIGWREWVYLVDLCPVAVKAKVDTGARTSTLHAPRLTLQEEDGVILARFEIHPLQRSRAHRRRVAVPVDGFRSVRSSSGHSERRPVVHTRVRLGEVVFGMEITLTTRDEMGFRMLLGREAVRGRFLIDPQQSFTAGKSRLKHRPRGKS